MKISQLTNSFKKNPIFCQFNWKCSEEKLKTSMRSTEQVVDVISWISDQVGIPSDVAETIGVRQQSRVQTQGIDIHIKSEQWKNTLTTLTFREFQKDLDKVFNRRDLQNHTTACFYPKSLRPDDKNVFKYLQEKFKERNEFELCMYGYDRDLFTQHGDMDDFIKLTNGTVEFIKTHGGEYDTVVLILDGKYRGYHYTFQN